MSQEKEWSVAGAAPSSAEAPAGFVVRALFPSPRKVRCRFAAILLNGHLPRWQQDAQKVRSTAKLAAVNTV